MSSDLVERLEHPVLVVEDDPLAAMLVRGLLRQRLQIDCDVALGEQAARQLLRKAGGGQGGVLPRMLIVDVHLRDGSGIDLITWVTMSGVMQEIAVFATSADDGRLMRQTAVDAGALDFAGKGELPKKLHEWAERAGVRAAA